ncbi:MAG TPA: type 4a pilus biogenesis protein PilO [Terriglobales bacterium]|jgi:type IV pilus assembly protein PilO|nr:type 4a pilus biogenesis protein PilO [Terriglobales bacterium]
MAKFSELSSAVQLGIVVGLAVLISGAAYWFVYRDMDNANRAMRTQLKAKEDENAALRPYADKKADMERKLATLKDQLEQMKRIVPDEKEAPQFMEMVQAEARKAGIEVRRYAAKATSQKEFFTEVPFDVELDGSYYSLLRFFENVAHLDRIINVSGLKMASLRKAGEAGVKKQYQYAPTETVAVTAVATTFFSREITPGPSASMK